MRKESRRSGDDGARKALPFIGDVGPNKVWNVGGKLGTFRFCGLVHYTRRRRRVHNDELKLQIGETKQPLRKDFLSFLLDLPTTMTATDFGGDGKWRISWRQKLSVVRVSSDGQKVAKT